MSLHISAHTRLSLLPYSRTYTFAVAFCPPSLGITCLFYKGIKIELAKPGAAVKVHIPNRSTPIFILQFSTQWSSSFLHLLSGWVWLAASGAFPILVCIQWMCILHSVCFTFYWIGHNSIRDFVGSILRNWRFV